MSKVAVGGFSLASRKNDSFFCAHHDSGKVILKWATASVEYFDHIVIERSADGQNFIAIIVVMGKSFLHQEKNHSSIDLYPLTGKAYYRLRMVCLEGIEKSLYTDTSMYHS